MDLTFIFKTFLLNEKSLAVTGKHSIVDQTQEKVLFWLQPYIKYGLQTPLCMVVLSVILCDYFKT